MEIRSVGAELPRADRQTGRHDEANSRFSQNCVSFLQRNCKCCVSQLVSFPSSSNFNKLTDQ